MEVGRASSTAPMRSARLLRSSAVMDDSRRRARGPPLGVARPSSIRSVVVLPAPLGPRKPVTRLPCCDVRTTDLSTAATLPKRLVSDFGDDYRCHALTRIRAATIHSGIANVRYRAPHAPACAANPGFPRQWASFGDGYCSAPSQRGRWTTSRLTGGTQLGRPGGSAVGLSPCRASHGRGGRVHPTLEPQASRLVARVGIAYCGCRERKPSLESGQARRVRVPLCDRRPAARLHLGPRADDRLRGRDRDVDRDRRHPAACRHVDRRSPGREHRA